MLDPAPHVVRPGAFWYAASLVLLVAGVGLAAWQIGRSVAKVPRPAQPVREQGLVDLKQAGSHSLYVSRYASQRMDESADRAWDAAKTANVSIRNEQTGARLAVKNVYETIDVQNSRLARLVEFDVPAPGEFRVQITPPLAELKPAIQPSVPLEKLGQEIVGVVVGVAIGIGIGLLALLVAAVLFIVVLLRRRSSKKRLAQTAAVGMAT